MYDPMVAKLIVWDVDREHATRRMLRALGEYEIGGLTTLIPFHRKILETAAMGERRDLPRPDGGPRVAEDDRARGGGARRDRGGRRGAVSRDYKVEVSGKLFDVTVIGEAAGRRRGGACGRRPQTAETGAEIGRRRRRLERGPPLAAAGDGPRRSPSSRAPRSPRET